MHKKPHILPFDDPINISRNFDPENMKIDENSNKNILIYFIRYVMIKNLKHVKISFVNRLYHIFSEVNGYFEEINKRKYLTLVPTNESKEIIKKTRNCGVKSEI